MLARVRQEGLLDTFLMNGRGMRGVSAILYNSEQRSSNEYQRTTFFYISVQSSARFNLMRTAIVVQRGP
jgi:hypothetical protein